MESTQVFVAVNNKQPFDPSHRNGERGSVVAYTVLSALFLFFAVGLGVDLSHLYLVKTELQNTADAAALAGASALTLPNDVRITTAVDRAINVMNANKYNFNRRDYVDQMSLEDQRALVRFAVNLSDFDSGDGLSEEEATAAPEDIRFVRVNTPTVPISMFFSIPLMGLAREMSARAVSGLSIQGNISVCIAPLSAIMPNQEGEEFPPEFVGNCPTANPQALQPVPPSGPDPDGDGFCNPRTEFCKGCTYIIRAEPAGGPSPGNYQILACAGNGASEVRDALARYNNCRCGLKAVGDTVPVPTQPGADAGPVRQGLNVRFDIYSGGLTYSADIPPDSNIAQGTSSGTGTNETWSGISWSDYQTGTPDVDPSSAHGEGVGNRRVLIIPMILHSEFDNGRDDVAIAQLGGFFMKSQVGNGNNGDIRVEYIGDDIIGVIGFDPNDDNITNIVTPVLYR